MADKLRTQQQLESLQAKYVGTGHADTTKHEWTSNIARDSYASYIGHPPLLHYMSIGMGMPMELVRMHCLEKMLLPMGPAPVVEDEKQAKDDDEMEVEVEEETEKKENKK